MTWQLAVEAMRIGIAGTPLGGAVVSAQARNLAGQLDQWAERIRTAKPHQVGDVVREALRMTDTMTRQLEAMPLAEREYLTPRIQALRTMAYDRESQDRAASTADHVAPPVAGRATPATPAPAAPPTAERQLCRALRAEIARAGGSAALDQHSLTAVLDLWLRGSRDLSSWRGITTGEMRGILADAGVPRELRGRALEHVHQTIARVVHDEVVRRAMAGVQTLCDEIDGSRSDPAMVARIERLLCAQSTDVPPPQAVEMVNLFERLGGDEVRELRDRLARTQEPAAREQIRAEIRAIVPAAIARASAAIHRVAERLRTEYATDNRHLGGLRDFQRVSAQLLREQGIRNPHAVLEGGSRGSSVIEDGTAHFVREHDAEQSRNELMGALILAAGGIAVGAALGPLGAWGLLLEVPLGAVPDAVEVGASFERAENAELHAGVGLQSASAARDARAAAEDQALTAAAGQVLGVVDAGVGTELRIGGNEIGVMGTTYGLGVPVGQFAQQRAGAAERERQNERDLQDEVARQRTQRPRI